MSEPSGKPAAVDWYKVLREARDLGVDRCARVVLTVTSSGAYSRASSALGKPGLIAAAVARHVTDTAMTQLLSRVNMPSRTDVLSLSTRLTHIEMALDDLGAALDVMRASAVQPPAMPKRAAGSSRAPR